MTVKCIKPPPPSAVRSQAVVLLSLIFVHIPPLFAGVLCMSLLWYALLYVLSSFAIILARKRELVVFLLLSFGCLDCYCKCHVALHHGALA